MAFTYGFYNSINGDRRYDAQQMSAIFDGIITDGVFSSVGGIFATVPGEGMTVVVKSGRAWFDHTWSYNDGAMPLSIQAADVTLKRYDAVVLEVNNTESVRENAIKVIKGTPATNPVKPGMTNTETVHQHPLAYVLIDPGATSITADKIDIRVGQSDCPFSTAILQTVSIADLFNAWESEFDQWFANVQAQLEGNVVTNLQKQIDDRVKIADKATSADLAAATPNKWVDAAGLKESQYKIGDIVYSVRNEIGDNWALCNGSDIDPSTYPELQDILLENYKTYRKWNIIKEPPYEQPKYESYWCWDETRLKIQCVVTALISEDVYHITFFETGDYGTTWVQRGTYSDSSINQNDRSFPAGICSAFGCTVLIFTQTNSYGGNHIRAVYCSNDNQTGMSASTPFNDDYRIGEAISFAIIDSNTARAYATGVGNYTAVSPIVINPSNAIVGANRTHSSKYYGADLPGVYLPSCKKFIAPSATLDYSTSTNTIYIADYYAKTDLSATYGALPNMSGYGTNSFGNPFLCGNAVYALGNDIGYKVSGSTPTVTVIYNQKNGKLPIYYMKIVNDGVLALGNNCIYLFPSLDDAYIVNRSSYKIMDTDALPFKYKLVSGSYFLFDDRNGSYTAIEVTSEGAAYLGFKLPSMSMDIANAFIKVK